jgi:signal transduction histidine kinase/putative methionine-R-sulfoxide reductase with GAF domain
MPEPSSAASPRRLADFLRERKQEILDDWEAIVRRMQVAERLARPMLLDHMPEFLDDLIHFVDDTRRGEHPEPPEQYPRIHALERLEIGYDLAEVVSEYSTLRTCITALIVRAHAPSTRSNELPRLHQAIDQAIASSVVRYSEARERTLKALDRISTMALVHHDVEALLPRTLEVLLETTAAVDSVAILLREDEGLRLRAAVGLPPGAESGHFNIGACFAGRVAQAGAPLFLRDAQHDPTATDPLFREAGTHALYGVPMMLGEELLGVALMGSRTTYEFSQEDQFLFRTMANRATALLAQARIAAELKTRAAELEAVIEAIPEGVFVNDASGVKRANSAGLRMIGYDDVGQLRGALSEAAGSLDMRRAASGLPVKTEELVVSRAMQGESATDEIVVRNQKTGEQLVLRCAAAPIRLDGQVIGAVTINTDVTAKREEERELRAALNFRDRMLGVLSHDLRSPLSVITTSAALLERKGGLDEAQARGVGRIAQNAGRIERLIHDLLDYTRAKQGRGIPLQRRACDLLALCHQVIDNARVLSPERLVTLSAKGDSSGMWDPDRAIQVISNLVTNALRYSPPETAVEVSLEDQQDAVLLRIHNLGRPIAAEVLPTIFEAFQRGGEAAEATQPTGFGLGLYIVQQIVAAHAGTISVHSTEADGTTFTVRWPRAP